MVITTNGHFRTCSVARKECRHNKLWNNFSLTCDLEKNEPGRFRTKKFSMKLFFPNEVFQQTFVLSWMSRHQLH